ncbi:MAG TPA: hypothetical protein VFG69_18385 [Nannocystaceae bacterium]|nr:hypothetical protein [Nannocystaceae bacterium]
MLDNFDRRTWVACVASLTIACTVGDPEPFGADAGEGTGGSGDGAERITASATSPVSDGPGMTGATNDTSDSECGPAAVCLTAPPEGWFGPVAVAKVTPGDLTPACPAGFPDSGLTLLSGYHDPGPASCECECMLSGTSACSSYAYDMDPSCGYQTFLQITQDCHTFAVDGAVQFSSFAQGNGFCQSMVTEDILPPEWDEQVTTCKMAELGNSCGEGGVCAPVPPETFEPSLCIYMEGEQDCPAGDFSEQFIHHSGVEDDRHCTYCGCGMAAASCMGSLNVYASADCTGAPIGNCPNNMCTMGIAGGHSVAIDYGEDGVCPVMTPPEAEGSISVTGAFTYCCQP